MTGSGGGFVLLTSTQLLETLAHFSGERIPEKAVHAKAAGARGYYEVTDDVSDITDADFLTGIGKGQMYTVGDFRGFAVKFKTNQDNNNWVFNNQPIFFVRDPVIFPSLNRSHKRHPGTNTPNADMFWDFHINNQESIHALMFLFGDRGLPSSVRHVNGYSGNTYKFTKEHGSYVYVRIHLISNQGTRYFTNSEGAQLAGTDPDRHLADLQEAINAGDFPSWNVLVQVTRPSEISKAPINIFDMTKVGPKKLYPLRKMGRVVLDHNPSNWFAEIEQAAFGPSNMVPGIAPSPDPMLQARMSAYPDAARYRLVGTRLKPVKFANVKGSYPVSNAEEAQLQAEKEKDQTTLDHAQVTAPCSVFTSVTDADFTQARDLWRIMEKQEGAQGHFIGNVVAHVSGVTQVWIREEVYAMFGRVDTKLGESIKKVTETKIEGNHAHPHKTAWH
ncbi:uncharacterized protein Z518_07466 [Rhinocladiella mackenziei CBS 650.93]|uniref:Catalase core domain-containing protein n=1 Tax=Rhinocladiella mackenziei CBS 650.93 TaxID=1442369 RepID=A0A0D2H0G9_9EURO|nr:uncharacterized protein Z518_07466 [Rhinocladiella mackenziei CBS 650.93]KIX03913.1 hypothetical protein Z518_07466 [Rhinocladiella mackenziei CBS 650.93]